MSGRPVPWTSWDEWQALRDDLWSADAQRQELGLQQVCAWRLRGRLPLGVDTTAHLMDVRRADAEWQRSVACAAKAASSSVSTSSSLPPNGSADAALAAGELPLRLRYSLPLIRLVNGISDSQQRGRVASSIAVLSDAAGLPRALVDVRHEATHNDLPSLPLLRAATDSALSWLWDNYWDGQSRALAAVWERIGTSLGALANSWRAATAAGLSNSAIAQAAAAAMAAAAADDEDNDDDDDEGGVDNDADGGGYNGSGEQKIRRQAIAEIRSLVPQAFTRELLQPILDSPVLLPPELARVRPAQPHQHQQQQQSQQQQQRDLIQQQRELVDAKAWCATMSHLIKEYPRLRPLLLERALQRLVYIARTASSPAPAGDATATAATGATAVYPGDGMQLSADKRAHVYGLWVLRLLPAAAAAAAAPHSAPGESQHGRLGSPGTRKLDNGRKAGTRNHTTGGGGSKAAKKAATATATATVTATPASYNRRGSLSGETGAAVNGKDGSLRSPMALEQLQRLLLIATVANPGPEVASSAASDDGSVTATHVLGEVIAALQRAMAQASSATDVGGKKRKRQAATSIGTPSAGDGDGGGVPGPEAAERQSHAEDGNNGSCADCAAATAATTSGNGEKRSMQERPLAPSWQAQPQQRQSQPPPRPRRWQRCTEWSKCAIGCLPCPLNPSGRLPPLVPPPLPITPQNAQPLLQPDGPVPCGLAPAVAPASGLPGSSLHGGSARVGGLVGAGAGLRCEYGATEYGNDDMEYYMEPVEADGLEEAVDRVDIGRGAGDGERDDDDNGDEGDGDGGNGGDMKEGGHVGKHVTASLFGALLVSQPDPSSGPGGTASVGFLL